METKKNHAMRTESGFALLITLIVVGVVLSVGLAILDLSIKQVQLSTNAKESERAFHAANAGTECARFWRRSLSNEMEAGQDINPTCFNEATFGNVRDNPAPGVDGDGEVHSYSYSFTWGVDDPRCTEIITIVASSSPLSAGVTTTNMTTLVPGYPRGDAVHCEPGAKCTVVSVKGYNRTCATVTGYGTVQREVLLEF